MLLIYANMTDTVRSVRLLKIVFHFPIISRTSHWEPVFLFFPNPLFFTNVPYKDCAKTVSHAMFRIRAGTVIIWPEDPYF